MWLKLSLRTANVDRHSESDDRTKWSGWVAGAWLVALIIASLSLHAAYSRWLYPLNRRVPTQVLASSAISGSVSVENSIPVIGDERSYYSIALNLLNGRGYSQSRPDQPPEPTAYRPPLFPSLLAMMFWISGPSFENGLRVNQALIVLLIPVSFWLGKSLHNTRCGLIAATMVALWPHGFYFGSFVLTEPLFTVLQAVTFGLLLRSVTAPAPKWAAMAGIAAAATVLTRPSFAVVVILLGLWFLVLSKGHRSWRLVGVFWATVALVISPWVFRNYLAMDTLIWGTTGSGAVFAGAHSAESLACCPGSWVEPRVPDQIAEMPEVKRDAFYWRMGFDFLAQTSAAVLAKLFVFKVLRLWVPIQRVVADRVCLLCNVLASLLYAILFLASAAGLWLHRSKRPILLLVAAFVGGTTLVSILFWGTTRFRMPLEPILWTFAAYTMTRLIEAYRTPWLRHMGNREAHKRYESVG
jgi:4-amino-4-deoxy-L-arabinose transferase-like glycosyltransferase